MMNSDDPEFMIAIIVAGCFLGVPILSFLCWSGYKAIRTSAHFDHDIDPVMLVETGRASLTPSARASLTPSARKPSVETINRENYDSNNQPRSMLRVDVPRTDSMHSSFRQVSMYSNRSGNEHEHSRQRNRSIDTTN